MIEYKKLIKDSASFIEAYLKRHESGKLRFHNLDHTLEVVEAVQVLAQYFKLETRERTMVIIAAYFHDTGYCEKGRMQHERRSAELAEQFLKEKTADLDMIRTIKECIMATQMPQSPKNLLEEILCDADLFHLGSDKFSIRDKLMQKEAAANGYKVDKKNWRKETLQFMQNHQFFTDYGRCLLEDKKLKNMESLKNKEDKKNGE